MTESLPGARTVRTYCRICESACGLVATVRGDRLEKLAPDREHPISQGFVCAKGTRFDRVHHADSRVQRPRLGSPRREVSWDVALSELGERLRGLLDVHGPDSVGIYSGNAAGHSLGAVLGVTALQEALGTTRHYSCLTLDNAPMFVVTEEVFGNPLVTATADYAESDCIVLVGTDPISSQPSQAQSHPAGVRSIVAASKRGVLTVVDPRRSITAARANHHLAPRVGTDVALLAFLVREAIVRRAPDPWLEKEDVASLAEAVASYRVERAADETGIESCVLQALADRLVAADRPLVWAGLGVLLGPEGTVAWWLTLALQAVLGGLDAPGGWRYHRGGVDLVGLASRLGLKGRDLDLRGRSGRPAVLGTLASADLAADALDDSDRRLRALIVVGGNPLAALPDTEAANRALQRLDLLVSVDLFENATGRLAHAVLPARSWAARPDVAVHMAPQRPRPHLQLTDALVSPVGEAREDWDILLGLARAAGRPAFGHRVADFALRVTGVRPTGLARMLVSLRGPLRWREVRRPGGAVGEGAGLRGGPPPRLAVPDFLAALRGRAAPEPMLRLLTSVRPLGAMNSWIREASPGEREIAVATVHPSDLISEGEAVLHGPAGRLRVVVRLDTSVRPGTVVLPFGATRGPNVVIGADVLEAFTGQPLSNGAAVWLEGV